MTLLILQVLDTASCGKRPQDWVGPRSGLGINEEMDPSHTRNKIVVIQPIAS